jgi:hypothetical protein
MRFVPDGWLDALLRPLLMADPVNGLYIEIQAPDARFAALAALTGAAWLAQRRKGLFQPHQAMTLLGLTVCFYVWTMVSGNGRYFIWGLLLAGPLVVMAAQKLPVTQAMRNTLVVLVLAVQAVSISLCFVPNMWGLRPWKLGPGLALEPTPLRDTPAVFLTLGNITYSVLVPQMHPRAHWSNLSTQRDVLPGTAGYPALKALFESALPRYVVVRATGLVMGKDLQPIPKAMASITGTLDRHGLSIESGICHYVRTVDAAQAVRDQIANPIDEGFWFCPVRYMEPTASAGDAAPVATEVDDVFAQVEQRCPRLFKPGSARSQLIEGAVKRRYFAADLSLYVDNSGEVYFKHDRALNPTTIASIEHVRAGQFSMDCNHIPGRYIPPWRRD